MNRWLGLIFLLAVLVVEGDKKEIRTEVIVPDYVKLFFTSIVKGQTLGKIRYKNANEYFDKLFVNVREYLAMYYDPVAYDNIAPEVKKITFKGLSTIFRSGISSVHSEDEDLILIVDFGFKTLYAKAELEKQLWWLFWLCGNAYVDITGMEIHLSVRAMVLEDRIKLHLEIIQIVDWGNMALEFVGTNWIGSIVDFFSPSTVTNQIESQLYDKLPSMLSEGVTDGLDSVTFIWSEIHR